MVVARRLFALVVAAGLAYAAWLFAVENAATVSVFYWVGEFQDVELWFALAVAFGLGAGVVGLYTLYRAFRSGLVARRYKNALAGLEAEVHQLRNLPLAVEEAAKGDETLGIEATPEPGRGA